MKVMATSLVSNGYSRRFAGENEKLSVLLHLPRSTISSSVGFSIEIACVCTRPPQPLAFNQLVAAYHTGASLALHVGQCNGRRDERFELQLVPELARLLVDKADGAFLRAGLERREDELVHARLLRAQRQHGIAQQTSRLRNQQVERT